jgi:hypothetical protein
MILRHEPNSRRVSGRDNWRRRLDGGTDRAGEAPPRDDQSAPRAKAAAPRTVCVFEDLSTDPIGEQTLTRMGGG